MVSRAPMVRSHSLASSLDSTVFSSLRCFHKHTVLLVFFLSLFLYPYFFLLRIRASQMQEILSFEFGSTYHIIPGIQRCCRENCVTSEGSPQFDLIFLRIPRKILRIQCLWSLKCAEFGWGRLHFHHSAWYGAMF